MLEVILNETKLVEKWLNEKSIDSKKPMTSINLLIKYYYLKKMNDEQMYDQLMEYLEDIYSDKFIFTKWDMTIRNSINKFNKDIMKYNIQVKMNDIEGIYITKNELDRISKLNNKPLEKIAFVMLVYAKISNIQMNNKESWINKSCNTICKEAKVGFKGVEQKRIMNQLYKLGYIHMSNNDEKTNIKINFLNEDSEEVIIINNFEGIIYYYLVWKGEEWKQCEVCNKKWFKPTNNKIKYCNDCAKKINIQKTIENRKKRNNV